MKTITSVLLVCASIFSTSCSSVDYTDPDATETLTIDWGSTDLQRIAGKMVKSLNESPGLGFLDNPGKGADKRIIMYMGGIENSTSEHIDTRAITDKMEAELVGAGKFRIVAAAAGQEEIGDQVRFQQGSGRVSEEMRRSFGKQLGADVTVYGVLRSIEKKKGGSLANLGTRSKHVYYQFTLKCVNIDTGELIWVEEKELSKKRSTSFLGSN